MPAGTLTAFIVVSGLYSLIGTIEGYYLWGRSSYMTVLTVAMTWLLGALVHVTFVYLGLVHGDLYFHLVHVTLLYQGYQRSKKGQSLFGKW